MSHHVIRNAGVGTLVTPEVLKAPTCNLCDMDTAQQIQFWSKLLDLKYCDSTDSRDGNNLRNILKALTKNASETNLLVQNLQTQITDLQKQLGEVRSGNLLQHTYE